MEISATKEVTRYGFTAQILHLKQQMCAAFRFFRVPEDSPKLKDVWIYKESCSLHAKLMRRTNIRGSANTHMQAVTCGESAAKLFEVGQGLLGPESVNKSGSVWFPSSGRTLN